jgi:hypothetical protein
MEYLLRKNEKSARLKWKMRSVKIKNPLTKIGKILSVKLKNSLGNIDNPLGKMKNLLGNDVKCAQ